jgi:hypothetical protein
MKMVKKLPLLLLIAAPFFMPIQTRANWLGDLLRDIFGKEKKETKAPTPPAASGNSVPINGGIVVLVIAGLGLGAKMLYDNKAKKSEIGGA